MLVVNPNLQPGEAPILCRTPGTPAPDGGEGTCGKFTSVAWVSSTLTSNSQNSLLIGLESKAGIAHIFDVKRADITFPRKCRPLLSLKLPGGSGPSCIFSLVPQCESYQNNIDTTNEVVPPSPSKLALAVWRGGTLSMLKIL